jgi:hypothetical protein
MSGLKFLHRSAHFYETNEGTNKQANKHSSCSIAHTHVSSLDFLAYFTQIFRILLLDQTEHHPNHAVCQPAPGTPVHRKHKPSFKLLGSLEGVNINRGKVRAVSCNAKKAGNFMTFTEF